MKEVKETLSTMKGQMTRFRKPGFLKKRTDENDERPLLNQSSGYLGPEVAYEPPLLALPMSTTYAVPEQHPDGTRGDNKGSVLKDGSGEFSMADNSLAPPSLGADHPSKKTFKINNAVGSSHGEGSVSMNNNWKVQLANVGSSTPPSPEGRKTLGSGSQRAYGGATHSPKKDRAISPIRQARGSEVVVKPTSGDEVAQASSNAPEDRRRRRFLGIGRPFTKSKEDTPIADKPERRGSGTSSDESLELEATVKKVQRSDCADSFAQMTFEPPVALSASHQPTIGVVQEDDESLGEDTIDPPSLAEPCLTAVAPSPLIQDSLRNIDFGRPKKARARKDYGEPTTIVWTRNKPTVRNERPLSNPGVNVPPQAILSEESEGAVRLKGEKKIIPFRENRVKKIKADIEARERRSSSAKNGRTARRANDTQTVGSGDKSYATGKKSQKSKRRVAGGKVSGETAEDDLSHGSSNDPVDDPLLGAVISPERMEAGTLEDEIRLILKLGKPKSPGQVASIPPPPMGSSPMKEFDKGERRRAARKKSLTATDAEFFLAATNTTKSPGGTISRAFSERNMMVWRRETGPSDHTRTARREDLLTDESEARVLPNKVDRKSPKHTSDADARVYESGRRNTKNEQMPSRRVKNGRRRRSMDFLPAPPLEGVSDNARSQSPVVGSESTGFSSPRRTYSQNLRSSGQRSGSPYMAKARVSRRGSMGQVEVPAVVPRRRSSVTGGLMDGQLISPTQLRGRPSNEAVVATAGLNVIDKVRAAPVRAAPSRRSSSDNFTRPVARTRSRRVAADHSAAISDSTRAFGSSDDRLDRKAKEGENDVRAASVVKPPSFHRLPSAHGTDDLIGEVQEAIRVARSGTDEERAAERQTKIQEAQEMEDTENEGGSEAYPDGALDCNGTTSKHREGYLTDVSEQSTIYHPSRSKRFSSKMFEATVPVSEEHEVTVPVSEESEIAADGIVHENDCADASEKSRGVLSSEANLPAVDYVKGNYGTKVNGGSVESADKSDSDPQEGESLGVVKGHVDPVGGGTKTYHSSEEYAQLTSLLSSSTDRVEAARKQVAKLEDEVERLRDRLDEMNAERKQRGTTMPELEAAKRNSST